MERRKLPEICEPIEQKLPLPPSKPEMLLFDYGGTLLSEPGFNMLRGELAVFEHIKENPRGVIPEQACALGDELFTRLAPVRELGCEVCERVTARLKYELLGITLNITIEEAERVMWNAASHGERLPHITELLDFLHENGIRTSVISNIGWSGEAIGGS